MASPLTVYSASLFSGKSKFHFIKILIWVCYLLRLIPLQEHFKLTSFMSYTVLFTPLRHKLHNACQ